MVSPNKYPKFLRVNNVNPSLSWNKYLLKPYEVGEVVKVAPIEEQFPARKDMMPLQLFRQKFVKVYRKDESKEYKLPYVASWETFELLTTPIKEVLKR